MNYRINSERGWRPAGLTCMLLLSFFVGKVWSADFGYGFEAGVEHSDNIRRSTTDKLDQTIAVGGASFSVQQATERLTVSALGEGKYLNYLGDAYTSEVIAGFSGYSRLAFVPKRFEWYVEDNFGTVRVNQLATDTPGNRESINYLSTGPTVSLPFDQRNSLKLIGSYSNVTYREKPVDENHYGGNFALLHALSTRSEIALNAGTDEVRFSNSATDIDYRRDEYYGSYNIGAARTQVNLDVGYTRLLHEDSKTGGTLARVGLTRKISPASSMRITFGHDLSNTAESLRVLQSNASVSASTLPIFAVGDVYTNDYMTIRWDFLRGLTEAYVNLSFYKAAYEAEPQLDRKWITSSFSLRRQIGPDVSAQIGIDNFGLQFDQVGQDYSEIHGNIGLDYRLGSRTYLSFRYDRYGRRADVHSTEYDENVLGLKAVYSVGERRARL